MINIAKLRTAVLRKVPDLTGYLDSDLTVKRFMDARPDMESSESMLVEHLKWRNEGRYIVPGGCATCPTMPGHHTWRQIGFDLERRPVIFYSVGHATSKSRALYKPYTTLTHIINLLDNGTRVHNV